jgi:hypothetical protein
VDGSVYRLAIQTAVIAGQPIFLPAIEGEGYMKHIAIVPGGK